MLLETIIGTSKQKTISGILVPKMQPGLDRAYYSPSEDYIGMPALGQFTSTVLQYPIP